MLSSADLHVGDLDFSEVLPMPGVAAIAGAARKSKDSNLLVLAVPPDLGRDLGTLDQRLAALHLLAVARDQHVIEGHLVPRLRVEQRDLDRDSRLGAELATTGRENRVTHRARNLNNDNRLVKVVDVGAQHAAPLPITPQRTAPSHRDPPAEPSSETHRAASSGRRAPRARAPSVSRVAAGS